MKKNAILITALLCFVSLVNATILIVDKNQTAPVGTYPEVNDALSVANPGDTIYITPAEATYSNVTLTKRVVIMGNGHHINPYNDYPWASKVANINISHTNAAGSVITGLIIENINSNANNVADVSIIKNRINQGITGSGIGGNNWIIRNNLFVFTTTYYARSVNVNNNNNWRIENNIFSGKRTSGHYYFIQKSNKVDVIITNNIFIGDSVSSGSYRAFSNITYAIITNNIFYVREPVECEYSNMSNNLTYRTVQDTLPFGNNTGAYNIPDQDPMFVNAPIESHSFDYGYDYHLSSGSPGINAGSDGRNIGIYGGVYPYSDIIPIPKVINVNVMTPNIHPGDSLEVKVKAVNY